MEQRGPAACSVSDHNREDGKEVIAQQGLGLPLGASALAANASHCGPDQRTGRRVWQALGFVRD